MRSLFLAVVGVGFALALPAVAQTSTPSSPAVTTSKPSGTANPNSPMTQQKMESDLKQAGFTDIRVVPEAFLIRATNKDGHPVMMMITPDSLTEITHTDSGTTENPAARRARRRVVRQRISNCKLFGSRCWTGRLAVIFAPGILASTQATILPGVPPRRRYCRRRCRLSSQAHPPSGRIPRHQFAALCAGTMTRYGGRSARLPAR